ncbi:YcaO-like family protein [Acinetobacter lactucae]|uniref:YcaO-like family protein n=1 Tax=Acinetobacter lactucae TaxID=1785128 RepID=UPI000F7693E1|nr:YcaO-like family protein [Acinetobacter lactucae]RSO34239.1 hypothetical protein EA763_10530 [Acinetobacter lactucae]
MSKLLFSYAINDNANYIVSKGEQAFKAKLKRDFIEINDEEKRKRILVISEIEEIKLDFVSDVIVFKTIEDLLNIVKYMDYTIYDSTYIVFCQNVSVFECFIKNFTPKVKNFFPVFFYGEKIFCLPDFCEIKDYCNIINILEKYCVGLNERILANHFLILDVYYVDLIQKALNVFVMLRGAKTSYYHPHYGIYFNFENGLIEKIFFSKNFNSNFSNNNLIITSLECDYIGLSIIDACFKDNSNFHGTAIDTNYILGSLRAIYELFERCALYDISKKINFISFSSLDHEDLNYWKNINPYSKEVDSFFIDSETEYWVNVKNLKNDSIITIPAFLVLSDIKLRNSRNLKNFVQGSAAHRDPLLSLTNALLEMVERDRIPRCYLDKKMFKLNNLKVCDDIIDILKSHHLSYSIYIADCSLAPLILVFIYDRNFNGCTGQASGLTLESAVRSALLNCLGVFYYKRSKNLLLDVRKSWYYLNAEEWIPTVEIMSANIPQICDFYNPYVYEVENDFHNINQKVFISSVWSPLAFNGKFDNKDEVSKLNFLDSEVFNFEGLDFITLN